MSFFDRISASIPFGKQKEQLEYYFALNISFERLTAALWTIEGKELKILDTADKSYSGTEQITLVADSLLDSVIGTKQIEPQKILFGVPHSWLADDNLKDEYLKLLRGLVKELELTPMAYVATTSAINHLLETQDGIPQTAILIGFERKHLTVTVVRAGKIDGVKILERGDNCGADIEKALLTFTDIETLPSKILLFGLDREDLEKLKGQLLSFAWMAKLSFLHFPKIEILQDSLEIKSVCLAGATELQTHVIFKDKLLQKIQEATIEPKERLEKETPEGDNFGFVLGDVSKQVQIKEVERKESPEEGLDGEGSGSSMEIDDFEPQEVLSAQPSILDKFKLTVLKKFIPKRNYIVHTILLGLIGVTVVLVGAYILLVKVQVKVFVEPRILEKNAQVVADPKQKEVLEDARIIPGQIIATEVSGTAKDSATGKRQIGDPARGTVIIRNKTDASVTLSKGTVFAANNQRFNLDVSVTIASRSADDGTWGRANREVTAQAIGADGNLPSGTDLTISGHLTDQLIAKSEGNFSGGTSKEVTVVSSEDQKRLLASLASTLRKQAQQKLQGELPEKKILEEALSEQILRKDYNKNVNDQANEFSLNMATRFKGTAFEEKDLKRIVGKLVTTEVPPGYELNLQDTETQADVAKLETDGRLIFLAKFRAKVLPKLDKDWIKNQIKGKTINEAAARLKSMENVLGSEFQMKPALPSFLQRLPILSHNMEVEVGLK
ncbi:baseplate J/gp47 family protein [Candidatus Daviesbacteria bacterium]|nr:baseplate J/gp47 family protein [Candidatus Daviesbacteria bacterium]